MFMTIFLITRRESNLSITQGWFNCEQLYQPFEVKLSL